MHKTYLLVVAMFSAPGRQVWNTQKSCPNWCTRLTWHKTYLLVVAHYFSPRPTGREDTEVLVTPVQTVSPVVTHHGVGGHLQVCLATEIGRKWRHRGHGAVLTRPLVRWPRCVHFNVTSFCPAGRLCVTGKQCVGHMTFRTYHVINWILSRSVRGHIR